MHAFINIHASIYLPSIFPTDSSHKSHKIINDNRYIERNHRSQFTKWSCWTKPSKMRRWIIPRFCMLTWTAQDNGPNSWGLLIISCKALVTAVCVQWYAKILIAACRSPILGAATPHFDTPWIKETAAKKKVYLQLGWQQTLDSTFLLYLSTLYNKSGIEPPTFRISDNRRVVRLSEGASFPKQTLLTTSTWTPLMRYCCAPAEGAVGLDEALWPKYHNINSWTEFHMCTI